MLKCMTVYGMDTRTKIGPPTSKSGLGSAVNQNLMNRSTMQAEWCAGDILVWTEKLKYSVFNDDFSRRCLLVRLDKLKMRLNIVLYQV